MTARLPVVGGDNGDWGTVLNQYLQVSHDAQGNLLPGAVSNVLPSPIPVTNLGNGTASSSNFLRGDGVWAVPTGASAATNSTPGLVQLDGDLGNTATTPEVVATHLSSPLPASQGGTGQASVGAAYNALSPMTTVGDIEYESGANTAARLPGNISTQKMFLSQTGTGSVSAAPVWVAQNYGGLFGDGSDGAAVLNGTNTVAWATLSGGNTYTMTRDAMLTSLTINSGITLLEGGTPSGAYRIFCAGSITNKGTWSANGASASGTTAGGNGAPGSIGGGGAGGTPTTTTGGSGTALNSRVGVGTGGLGGNNGSGSNRGNPGGIQTATITSLRSTGPFMSGSVAVGNNVYMLGGGTGAGAGGGDGTNTGGAGGAGGGVIAFSAWSLVNNGTMEALGGNGSAGAGGTAGGGGGGGGGLVLGYTLTAWTNNGTMSVAGGSPGNGVSTGANGSAGGAGNTLNVIVQ